MKRYVSLDVLRGLTVAAMILVNNPGSRAHVFAPLKHSAWDGCTPADLVFPFFLFCVGVSMAFSLAGFSGLDRKAAAKIFRRGALIFLTGLVLNLFPFYPPQFNPEMTFWENYGSWLHDLRVFGVLQRIGLCFVAASVLVLVLKKTNRIFLTIFLLAAVYTAILLIFGTDQGPFSLEGNISGKIDVALVGESHVYHGFRLADGARAAFDPEGLLGTITGTGTVLLGYLSGMMIRRTSVRYAETGVQKDSPTGVSVRMFSYAVFSIAFAVLLTIWIPLNKPLWSASYMFYTGGWAMLVLALFVYLIDVNRISAIFYPFKALGVNPLAIYCLSWMVSRIIGRSGLNVSSVFGANEYMSLLYSLLFVTFHLVIAIILYRKKIFIKI